MSTVGYDKRSKVSALFFTGNLLQMYRELSQESKKLILLEIIITAMKINAKKGKNKE